MLSKSTPKKINLISKIRAPSLAPKTKNNQNIYFFRFSTRILLSPVLHVLYIT